MGETPTPNLDDATVEAIAREIHAANPAEEGDEWTDWIVDVCELAPIFAKHLPDPRPTEAEVLVSANDLRLALSPQPPSHWPAWDDWHAARDRLRNAAADREGER